MMIVGLEREIKRQGLLCSPYFGKGEDVPLIPGLIFRAGSGGLQGWRRNVNRPKALSEESFLLEKGHGTVTDARDLTQGLCDVNDGLAGNPGIDHHQGLVQVLFNILP